MEASTSKYKSLGEKANSNRPEITQVLFKHNNKSLIDKDLERNSMRLEEKLKKKQSKII